MRTNKISSEYFNYNNMQKIEDESKKISMISAYFKVEKALQQRQEKIKDLQRKALDA